jgi:hypothetical protein
LNNQTFQTAGIYFQCVEMVSVEETMVNVIYLV